MSITPDSCRIVKTLARVADLFHATCETAFDYSNIDHQPIFADSNSFACTRPSYIFQKTVSAAHGVEEIRDHLYTDILHCALPVLAFSAIFFSLLLLEASGPDSVSRT